MLHNCLTFKLKFLSSKCDASLAGGVRAITWENKVLAIVEGDRVASGVVTPRHFASLRHIGQNLVKIGQNFLKNFKNTFINLTD